MSFIFVSMATIPEETVVRVTPRQFMSAEDIESQEIGDIQVTITPKGQAYVDAHREDVGIQSRFERMTERTERNAVKLAKFAADPHCSRCRRQLVMQTGHDNTTTRQHGYTATLVGTRLACVAHPAFRHRP